jgi:hypothetical protein
MKDAMTLSIITGRNLKLEISKVNLLFDQSFRNGKMISKSEGQVKQVSELGTLASLHLRKINIISSWRRYRMLMN